MADIVYSSDFLRATFGDGASSVDYLNVCFTLPGYTADFVSTWFGFEQSNADFLNASFTIEDKCSADFLNANFENPYFSADVLYAILESQFKSNADFIHVVMGNRQTSNADVLHALFSHETNVKGVLVVPEYEYDKRSNKKSQVGWKIMKK